MLDDTLPDPLELRPSATAYAFLNDESREARWISAALVVVATAALLGNCLLTCPARFSEKHIRDTSLLRPIVSVLGLGGHFPTDRGVEIRNLVFYIGAAALALLAGLRLMMVTRSPRLSFDDLLDVKRRMASPYFWWILLLLVSFFSSYYSHAPTMCTGQLIIRLLDTAWWWPLATLLAIVHVRTLAKGLVTALGLMSALGLWYYVVRVLPDGWAARLSYPIGNELWMGACVLPGIFVAAGLILSKDSPIEPLPRQHASIYGFIRLIVLALAVLAMFSALFLTRSRSGFVGFVAGILTLACFTTGRVGRRIVLLIGLLAGLGGSFYVHRLLQDGSAQKRAHSVRSRLMYEWPYALHLFFQKPVAGNGDGGYAMLAGKLARDDQLDDPSTLRLDEWSWPGHAHNEYLELLSDLGLVGLTAYVAAIALTLYRAMRFCDRCPSSQRRERWLAIGLAAALVASAIEQGGDPAIREAGLSPIFLTVWAALWALARQQIPQPLVAADSRPFPLAQIRLGGIAICVLAALLGWYGIQDWRGARARFAADRAIDQHEFAPAIAHADFAEEHLLDPFRRALARMIAVSARSLAFDAALARSPGLPSDAELKASGDAMIALGALDHDVPRFLRVSRINAELQLNRARAFQRRGDKLNETDSQARFINALLQNQKDEPFLLDRVQALWKVRPDAGSLERLGWLRCLMRGGEVGDEFLELFRTLPNCRDFTQILNDLFNVATKDATRAPREWHDRLSPETYRAAAMAKALAGAPEEAARIAASAEDMYARAGQRLFAAHSAAIHEEVRYRITADPLTEIDGNLQRLARADSLLEAAPDPSLALAGPLGETRLLVLVAAGRTEEAKAQIKKLAPSNPAAESQQLALATIEIASRCLANPQRGNDALRFARQAVERAPKLPDAHATLLSALLQTGRDPDALAAVEGLLVTAPDRKQAAEFLARLENRHPHSGIWAQLWKTHPGLRTATTQPMPSKSLSE